MKFKIYKAWINPNLPAVATLKLGSPQVWPLREKAGCPTQLLFNCLKFCRNHPFQVKIYSFTEFAVVVTDCFVGECIMCQIMYKWILKISEYWIKGNIISWPDICRPNWPKIFPFFTYSSFSDIILIYWEVFTLKLSKIYLMLHQNSNDSSYQKSLLVPTYFYYTYICFRLKIPTYHIKLSKTSCSSVVTDMNEWHTKERRRLLKKFLVCRRIKNFIQKMSPITKSDVNLECSYVGPH